MKPLRRLSAIEANMAWHHTLYAGSTQVSTLLSLRVTAPWPDVAAAAAALRQRHALLRCTIAEYDGELWFEEPDDLDNVDVDTRELPPALSTEAALRNESNRPVDPARALWRLLALRDQQSSVLHLVFTRHHAMSDAFTSQVLLTDLVALLEGRSGAAPSAALSAGADALWQERPHAPQPPPVQAFPALPHAAPFAPGTVRTSFHSVGLSPAESQQLYARARSVGLTINALASAALAQSYCDTLDQDGCQYMTAVSLRERLAPGRRITDIGCMIGVQACALSTRDRNIEAVARDYHQSLMAGLDAYRPPPLSHAAIRQRLAGLADARHFGGIGITNMGKLDGQITYQGQAPLQYLTVVNRNACAAPFVLHLSTFGQSLWMTFTYPEKVANEELVLAVAEGSRQRLRQFAMRCAEEGMLADA